MQLKYKLGFNNANRVYLKDDFLSEKYDTFANVKNVNSLGQRLFREDYHFFEKIVATTINSV